LNTSLIGSSVHDCYGYCINGNFAHYVNLENNIIYVG